MEAERTRRRRKKSLTAATLYDAKKFACEGCFAAAAQGVDLQTIIGCEKPAAHPVAGWRVLGAEVVINRCPRAIGVTPETLAIIDRAAMDYLGRLDPREVLRLPNLLVAGIEYVRAISAEASERVG